MCSAYLCFFYHSVITPSQCNESWRISQHALGRGFNQSKSSEEAYCRQKYWKQTDFSLPKYFQTPSNQNVHICNNDAVQIVHILNINNNYWSLVFYVYMTSSSLSIFLICNHASSSETLPVPWPKCQCQHSEMLPGTELVYECLAWCSGWTRGWSKSWCCCLKIVNVTAVKCQQVNSSSCSSDPA